MSKSFNNQLSQEQVKEFFFYSMMNNKEYQKATSTKRINKGISLVIASIIIYFLSSKLGGLIILLLAIIRYLISPFLERIELNKLFLNTLKSSSENSPNLERFFEVLDSYIIVNLNNTQIKIPRSDLKEITELASLFILQFEMIPIMCLSKDSNTIELISDLRSKSSPSREIYVDYSLWKWKYKLWI